ncbi:divergent polysaccharide deacetylase family protein [Syntrophus buswellii]|uniref:divergent polysaccharide deacetylase family protein n=1 Tax=Syntrophus TaxID=43773 RepID=UPI00345E7A7E
MNKKATGRSQRKGRKGADPFKTIKRIVILLLLVVAAAVFYELFSDRPGEEKLPPAVSRPVPGKHAPMKQEGSGKAPPVVQEPREKGTPAPSPEPEKRKPASQERLSGLQVAILIDDIGFDLSSVKNLLKIEAPISFAILPHRPHSVAAAEMIHKAGRDILLHLPMEPHAYPKEKPGPGALFTAMNHDELKKVLTRNLDSVPHISGVNNHMGSLFTEDEEKMVVVMKELKGRGLFFIDSRTTAESKAAPASREVGVPFAARQIFIDNGQDYRATRRILLDVLSSSKGSHRGLVLIGHPYAGTIAALEKVVPEWKSRGVLIVPVSHMVQ